MHKHCEKCVDKKLKKCTAMNLEETDFSDTNNNNAVIANEGNTKIANEKISFKGLGAPMLFHRDEGETEISVKKHDVLQNKLDE